MSSLILVWLKRWSANRSETRMAQMKLLLGRIDADRPQLDESSLPGISCQWPKYSKSVYLMYCDKPNTTEWKKAKHWEDKLGKTSHDNTMGLFQSYLNKSELGAISTPPLLCQLLVQIILSRYKMDNDLWFNYMSMPNVNYWPQEHCNQWQPLYCKFPAKGKVKLKLKLYWLMAESSEICKRGSCISPQSQHWCHML